MNATEVGVKTWCLDGNTRYSHFDADGQWLG